MEQQTQEEKNLTKDEEQALNSLKNRTDIVITKADKGGAVVIQDVEQYVQEANRQLSDTSVYEKIPHDQTEENSAIVNNCIDQLKKDLKS